MSRMPSKHWRQAALALGLALGCVVHAAPVVDVDMQAWQRQIEEQLEATQFQLDDIKHQDEINALNLRWLWIGLGCSIVTLIGIMVILFGQQRTRRKLEAADMQLGMVSFALDHVNEAAYLVDTEHRLIYANEGACRSLGYSRKELLGMRVSDIDPDAGLQALAQMASTVSRVGQLTLERRHRAKDGRIFPVEMFSAAFVYAGQLTSIFLVRDITQRKQAEKELEKSRVQLRGLAAHLETAREQERKRIAREVHDELGQVLTALQLNVAALTHQATNASPPLRELSQETMQLTDRALAVVRNVTASLRPVVLDMGIASALEWEAKRFAAKAGIECDVQIQGGEREPDEIHAIALFRIVQESLTNVARHARAERVEVCLEMGVAGCLLTVSDDGVGFDVDASKADSFGLVGIQERALMLGGTVRIDSCLGEGTKITVRLPALEQES